MRISVPCRNHPVPGVGLCVLTLRSAEGRFEASLRIGLAGINASNPPSPSRPAPQERRFCRSHLVCPPVFPVRGLENRSALWEKAWERLLGRNQTKGRKTLAFVVPLSEVTLSNPEQLGAYFPSSTVGETGKAHFFLLL